MKKHRMLVRPYHCDAYGHVNNARYLEIFEEGRWNLLGSAELDDYLANHNIGMVVVDLHIQYKRPALPGEWLNISAEISQIGNSSFTILQHIHLDDDHAVAEASVKLVMIDLTSGRPVKMVETLRKLVLDAAQKDHQ